MKLLHKTIFSIYLFILVWLLIFKFARDLSWVLDYDKRSLTLVPFVGLSDRSISEIVLNFLAFVPFGLLLGVNNKRAVWTQRLACIVLFSVLVEAVQYIFAIGATDITDVITNALGGLTGLAIYGLCSRGDTRRLDKLISTLLAGLFVVLLGFLLLHLNMDIHSDTPKVPQTVTHANTIDSAQLSWPATGEAAIGTVQDGVLARSTEDQQPRPTASMAKVIAALAIMEKQPFMKGQQGKTYTVTAEDMANLRSYIVQDGSVLPLRLGEKLTQYEAMQRMLIASDNNMADMLTERIFGSRQAYITYAEGMLHRMGLSRTVVTDASGFSPQTVSTPSELISIGIAALQNPVIASIVSQPYAQFSGIGTVNNTNELLGADGVVGIKTGTTDEAGSCLLFAARSTDKNGKNVMIVGVVMGDSDHRTLFNDSAALLASARQSLHTAI